MSEVDLGTFLFEFLSSKETIGFLSGFVMSVLFVVWLILPRKKKEIVEEVEPTNGTVVKKRKQQEQGLSKKQLLKLAEGKRLEVQFSHPSLAGHLRGHQDFLTDLSFDEKGRYLVTASQGKWNVIICVLRETLTLEFAVCYRYFIFLDRTLRIWYAKDFNTNDHR